MRRALLALVSTAAGLVLLLGFKTQSLGPAVTPPAAIATSGGTSGGGTSAGTTGSAATRTVTGDAASTRYGPVQVQVTLAGTKLTAVSVVQYPANSPRDMEINAYALPVLTREALAAGNANIDMVSGATFTSVGYAQSLQSALDKAGIAR